MNINRTCLAYFFVKVLCCNVKNVKMKGRGGVEQILCTR